MDNKFYKVDLHVHTPASKCYKGDKSENGYWEILRSAVTNGVRLIAITDHNTIAGYEKLIELKENTIQEYNIIKKYNIPNEEKKELQEKVNLFKKVSIIMGVEITLNPGVHIIVLSDEESKKDIDSLLSDIGYSSENRGIDTDIVPEMDIKTFLLDDRLTGKIVLAPHVDSAKGIWDVLEGNYRALIFKSNVITAITCNNASQLDMIKDLTKNDPTYKRTKPFVCVNASDAHEQSVIGKKHSYFKLLNFSFADLKKAFDSPDDSISDTERQDFIDYVKKCTEYKPTIFLNDIKNLEIACYAVLNYGYGCILLGINIGYQQNGIELTCEQIKESIDCVFKSIQSNNDMRYVSYKVRTDRLGNGKNVGIIVTDSDESRLWINKSEELYIYSECEKPGYKIAGIREVEKIIRERILTELQGFEERNNDNIWDAMSKMRHVLNTVSKYALYDKFKAFSVPITHYFDIEPITRRNKSEGRTIIPENGIGNGAEKGNVYYTDASSPRLEDAYLRYSCPVYQNDDEDYLSSLFEIKTPVIVVTLGGGCHIIDPKEKCYFECKTPAILLIPNDQFIKANISLYHIIAWLKSDCFIWTCIQKGNDVDLFSPKVLFSSFVPYLNEFYEDILIKEKVEEILSLEQRFLRETQAVSTNDKETIYELNEKCYMHNELINKKSAAIERRVKKHFNIDEDENDMINNDLVDTDIFHYELKETDTSTQESELTFV